jgi:glutathione S-transferase
MLRVLRCGYNALMLELYQAEWCPHSRKVRQRLTELGVDFVARQVAVDARSRKTMRQAIGLDEIPVLVLENGETLAGDDAIIKRLDRDYPSGGEETEHRAKALEHAGLPDR